MSEPSPQTTDSTASPALARRSWWRRGLRLVLSAVLFAFGALAVCLLLLQIPFVQQYVAHQITRSVSETLQAPVKLEKIRLRWFDELSLQGLYVEDLHADTLLLAGDLFADLNLNPFVLLTRGLEVEALALRDARFKIRRDVGEAQSNLEITLARLFPPDTTRQAKPFQLNLREIELERVAFIQSDSVRGQLMDVYVERGAASLRTLDLPNKIIDVASLSLTGPRIRMANYLPNPIGIDVSTVELMDSIAEQLDDTLGLQITVDDFALREGVFQLDNFRRDSQRVTPLNQLDFAHLDVRDIFIDIENFTFARDTFGGRVNGIALQEAAGFTLNKLAGEEVQVSPRGITINGLTLETPYSSLGDTLRMTYPEYAAFAEFTDQVRLDIRLNEARVALRDIMTFVPKLEQNAFFRNNRNTALTLDGRVSRQINNLRVSPFEMRLEDGTFVSGTLGSRNLARPGEAFLNLELDQLRTTMRTLRELIPNFNPPENFNRLGTLDFSGRFDGFLVDFVANGLLRTNLGRASMDMRMNLKPGVRQAEYQGSLRLSDFDLGAWTQNEEFGIVNASTRVQNGVGLIAETASAELTAEIQDFSFRGYPYRNATLTGQLNRNFFNGDFAIQDENIDLAFQGELDFRDSIPQFDFAANVRKLDLRSLNLSKADLEIAGLIDINVRDTRFTDMTGTFKIRDLQLTKDRTERYRVDSIYAQSRFDAYGEKVFILTSDIGKAEIWGAFDIDELPGSLQQFLVRNYPGFANRLNIRPPRNPLEGNQFDYKINIRDSKGLNYLVNPKLGNLRDVRLVGAYDGIRDSLAVDLELPRFQFGDLELVDVILKMDAVQSEGDLDMVIDSTLLKGKYLLNKVTLLSILEGDTINFGLNYATDSPSLLDKLNLNGYFYLPDSANYEVRFRQSNLVLLEAPWYIDEDNTITFGKNYFDVQDFALSNLERRIELQKTGDKSLRLDLQRFNFDFINDVWDYDPLDFKGRFNATVHIDDVFTQRGFNAIVEADTFLINADDFGRFRLDATAADLKGKANAFLTLTNGQSQMVVKGDFNLADQQEPDRQGRIPVAQQKNYLALNITTKSFPLSLAEYWVSPSVTDVVGRFEADLKLTGQPEKLDVDGYINARDGAFTIDFLKTRYSFAQGFVEASNTMFDASGTVIRDRLGHTATIAGGISHDRLKNLGLSARLRTDRFLALDTRKGDNEMFYGQALGSGEIAFSGSFKQTNIYVNAAVGDSSYLTIPIDNQRDGSNLDLINFVNKYQKTEATVLDQSREIRGLSLEMDLSVSEEATVELVFDETVGDIIRGSGRGDIRILLPRNGEFQMFGQYIIERGNYLFTLYNVVNKDFRIKRGGLVTWSGDPFAARIQLEAEYKDLKASIAPFIQEYLVNADTDLRNRAATSTDVDLTLKLQGDLLTPAIDFDIDFPNLRGQLESYADNKLRLVKQDQNELNRQVFGLIVVGQFLPSDLVINSAGTAIATNTLSELLGNQLSLLLTQLFSEVVGEDNVLSGINFDIAYNQYTEVNLNSGEEGNLGREQELQLTLQKNFLNDRLSVQVGGNVDFGQAYRSAAPGTAGAFVGNDLVIEYILNRNRTLKLRVYQRLEPDIAGGSRLEIGTGISFRREFDSFGDFFRSFRKNASDLRQ